MSITSLQFSVIICTYKRPLAVLNILNSIELQSVLPFEVIIIDASEESKTQKAIENKFVSLNIRYFLVEQEHRGLTKQRNFGIVRLSSDAEIVIFLDDDLILEKEFCQNIISNFSNLEIIGAEGYITNELKWQKVAHNEVVNSNYFHWDSYQYKLGARDRVRKYLGLYPSGIQPGLIPKYGHGKSSLPPTNNKYFVEHIMGGITAYHRSVFNHIQFSEFFEGYGLYEDFDFSVRASKFGKLISDTSAKCEHHHDPSGRPNNFKYGKMVVWNGYYVWRLKHPKPGLINIIKWYLITILLIISRVFGLKKGGIKEGIGRINSLIKLQFKKPI